MAEKKIIALRIKAVLPSLNETVLVSAFIDVAVSEMLLFYNTVILGSDHEQFSVDSSNNVFVAAIFAAKDDYSIDTHFTQLVHEQFNAEFRDKPLSNLIEKIQQNDTGTVIYYFKRFLDHVFQVDDTNISLEFDTISHGVLEVINAIERKQSHTVAENREIAAKYVGQSDDLIKKVIENGLQDSIICVYTVERGGKYIVAGYLIYNTLVECLISRLTVFNQQLDSKKFSPDNYIVDLFHEIQSFADSDKNVRDVAQKIDNALSSLHSERLGLQLKSENSEKIAALLKKTFPTEYASASISVLCEKFNSIIVEAVFSPEISLPGKPERKESEEVNDIPDKKAAIVDVDLVLSPTKGVKLSTLKPGSRIYVIINGSSAIGRQVINKLNLMEDNRVKPVSGVLESIRRDSEGNYIVVTRIASNLFGKSLEEEDIKVKSGDPVVDKKESQSSRSLIVGLVIGFFIIVIAVLSFLIL